MGMGMERDGIEVVVDGCVVLIAQPLDACDVLRLGGLLGDGIVIRVDGGRAYRFAPADPVSFEVGAKPQFRTFRGAAHVLWVDGLRWDWGSPMISEADIRTISGRLGGTLWREEGGGSLRPGVLLDLTSGALLRLRSRPG